MNCLKEGNLLQDRYSIKEVLGKGAMGTIYLAGDSRFSQDRAIKEMNPSFLEENEKEQFMELFKQEAHILSRLHHLNLPRVIDYFFEDGRYYLVMDYIKGENLEEYNNKKSLSINAISKIICQLCEVLEYLHSQKPDPIIFRDLKPSNIMIMPDLTVKLIDFGIARVFKESSSCDTVAVGTPGFAPPEQYGKRQTDARSDIYSLGATLYYMLTEDIPDIPDRKGRSEIEKNRRLPDNLKGFILKALSHEAKNRHKNMRNFKEEFLKALESPRELMVKKDDIFSPQKPEEREQPVNIFFITNLTFLFMFIPSGILALMAYLGRMIFLPHLRGELLYQAGCIGGMALLAGAWFGIIALLRKIKGYNWEVLLVASIIPVLLNTRNIFTLLIPEWGQQTLTIWLSVVLFIIMYILSMVIATFFRHKEKKQEEIPVIEKEDIHSYIGQTGTVNATLRPLGNIIVDGQEDLFSACAGSSGYISEGTRVKIIAVKMGDLLVEAL